ncbi:MAG: NADP-dependent oxidoreductase [Pseudomonadota bacterium]
MAGVNHRYILRAHGDEGITAELFALEEAPVPEPGPGQCLIKVLWLSVDPAMRGWISTWPNYRDPVALGSVMVGFTVGQVLASRHPDYPVGCFVLGRQGWQEWALSDGSDIDRRLDPDQAPLTAHLHVLGHTGLTAYLGLMRVGQPMPGETVVVSTAAGAVGSTVGQIAKLKGCRTVGITGAPDKIASCLKDFGYDAALDYKAEPDLPAALGRACPAGIDVYFDNVGGEISDAVMQHLNVGARVVICGTLGILDGETALGPRVNRQLLVKRARMEGFLILDHLDHAEAARAELAQWYQAGKLRAREEVVDGLAQAPEALMRLLRGDNRGKMLVRVGAPAD